MALKSRGVPGLIYTPQLGSGSVTSLTMTFEPSLGIMARRVDKLGLDIRSFRDPLQRAIKEVVIPSIKMNFHKHGRPRWAELAESTIERKGHARPLYLTGNLQKVMGFSSIWHIDTEKALLANLPQGVWYGVVHQQGTGDPNIEADMWFDPVEEKMVNVGETSGVNIPARPFVLLQDEDVEAIDEIFLNWLDERALRVGWPTTARSKIFSGDF